jgi:hypothetical protein
MWSLRVVYIEVIDQQRNYLSLRVGCGAEMAVNLQPSCTGAERPDLGGNVRKHGSVSTLIRR